MMRRDFGNEFLVALGAISVLVFTLAFAVILIVTREGGAAVVTPSSLPPSATLTPVPPRPTSAGGLLAGESGYPTDPPLASATPRPTQTATLSAPSATSTAAPATNTATRQAVSTTAAPRATQTPTRVLPSATFTPTATFTTSPTRVPPTATFTASPTLIPPTATATPTATFTATRVPPTATFTATPIPPSATPRPTATPLVVNGCPIPPGWTPYVVQAGDNLFRLAGRVNSTSGALQAGNCLPNDVIVVGQTLYLPPVAGAAVTVIAPEGCAAPGARITSPLPGTEISGVVEVRGSASTDNFAFYRLEIRPADSQVYSELTRSTRPVTDGLLLRLDRSSFAAGLVYLRLAVVDGRGQIAPTCVIPLIFR